MLPTQKAIDQLAGRIEQAFLRRCAVWNRSCSTQRVWSAAAANLWRAHQENPWLPLDPELFVASQPIRGAHSDPWTDLTQEAAIHRYTRQVRRIVLLLRTELSQELARADRLIGRGIELSRIVAARKSRLSALGCYILVLRAGRNDLAAGLHDRALQQHRSCPLYRAACSTFLPDDRYPNDAPPPPSRKPPLLALSAAIHDASVN